MDHEKINYDLIVAVLEYIVVGEHEVCWTALSLNYSSLFYSSSLAFKYFLCPAFLEHKINNFLNRYQRRAPVPERFSFSPCLFCSWYCNWACGINWHTWIASNIQFSPFDEFCENFHSLCAKATQNPKFPISTERKKRKGKVIPQFSTATWPFPQRAKWSLAPDWQLLSIIFFCLLFLSLLFRRNFDFCYIINLWLSHSHL